MNNQNVTLLKDNGQAETVLTFWGSALNLAVGLERDSKNGEIASFKRKQIYHQGAGGPVIGVAFIFSKVSLFGLVEHLQRRYIHFDYITSPIEPEPIAA